MEHLNVLPDWDMFQTDHFYSNFHGAARCLSGGPIYITDIPGRHDVSLIRQMTAETTDGRSIILRPERIGRSSEIYIAHAEARLLRIDTSHQGASVLGLFNVGSSPLREIVNAAQFPGLADGKSHVLRHYSSGAISRPWSKQEDFSVVEVEVAERGFEILTASPIQTYGKTDISVLGLLGKMTGAAAIQSLSFLEATESSQVEIRVRLKALGSLGMNTLSLSDPWLYTNIFLGIYVSDEQINLDAVKLTVRGHGLRALRHLESKQNMLVIDAISAWAEYRDDIGDKNDGGKAVVFAIIIPVSL